MKSCLCCFPIREQDPLKQGLKLKLKKYISIIFIIIREQDPLKQGLKLVDVIF